MLRTIIGNTFSMSSKAITYNLDSVPPNPVRTIFPSGVTLTMKANGIIKTTETKKQMKRFAYNKRES